MWWIDAVQHREAGHQPGANCRATALTSGFHNSGGDSREDVVVLESFGVAPLLSHTGSVKDSFAVVVEEGILYCLRIRGRADNHGGQRSLHCGRELLRRADVCDDIVAMFDQGW